MTLTAPRRRRTANVAAKVDSPGLNSDDLPDLSIRAAGGWPLKYTVLRYRASS